MQICLKLIWIKQKLRFENNNQRLANFCKALVFCISLYWPNTTSNSTGYVQESIFSDQSIILIQPNESCELGLENLFFAAIAEKKVGQKFEILSFKKLQIIEIKIKEQSWLDFSQKERNY